VVTGNKIPKYSFLEILHDDKILFFIIDKSLFSPQTGIFDLKEFSIKLKQYNMFWWYLWVMINCFIVSQITGQKPRITGSTEVQSNIKKKCRSFFSLS
jgi:hypothetical protein